MQMAPLFETERLVVRRFTLDDAEGAIRMYGDPEVQRFLGRGRNLVASVEAQREALAKMLDKYGDGQFGGFAMVEKATGEIVGTILLKNLPDSEKIEIGWHLAKMFWGKGYATEAARAMLDYGFNVAGLETIYAVVFPENSASIRVTQRLGMTPIGRTTDYYGEDLEMFELKRP